jgi:hypothetical protein
VAEGVREQGRVVDGASRRLASWFAWVVCALSLALTALSYLLIGLISSLDAPIFFYWLDPRSSRWAIR